MSYLSECDRCGHQEQDTVANRELPSGWERVCGADLCAKCSRALHEFLQRLPEEASTT